MKEYVIVAVVATLTTVLALQYTQRNTCPPSPPPAIITTATPQS